MDIVNGLFHALQGCLEGRQAASYGRVNTGGGYQTACSGYVGVSGLSRGQGGTVVFDLYAGAAWRDAPRRNGRIGWTVFLKVNNKQIFFTLDKEPCIIIMN